MNIIQQELECAKKNMIEEITFEERKLANLTRGNVARIEAMICNDSAYILSGNTDAGPGYNGKKNYGGSSAYWMTQLKKILRNDMADCTYSYEEIIKNAVNAVDRENRTHLNADKCGREEITERLCKFDREELLKCLKDPDYENMKLIDLISKPTRAKRKNLSFASKFCHYACFYIFEGEKEQDNYPIYDSILKTVLPWYLKSYGIDSKKYKLNDYRGYRKAVDDILDALKKQDGVEFSRNGFDQLLWYYHKGRL